jgi:hypothetical protein
MLSSIRRPCCLALFIAAFPGGLACGQTCDTAAVTNRKATVLISAKNTLKNTGQVITREGTGFVVSSTGFVLTNRHVVEREENAAELVITGAIGSRSASSFPLEMIQADDRDLALLKFADTSKTYDQVLIGHPPEVKNGTLLCAGSFPLKSEFFLATGPRSGEEGRYWLTQMPSNPGDSGAPVFLPSGEVIAIKVGAYATDEYKKDTQNMNLLLPINAAQDLLALVPDSGTLDVLNDLIGREAELAAQESRAEDKAKEYSDLFTSDALVEDVRQHERWDGRERIRDRFRNLPHFKMLHHDLARGPRLTTRESAAAWTTTMLDLATTKPNETSFNQGNEFWTFARTDGKWRISSFRYNISPGEH